MARKSTTNTPSDAQQVFRQFAWNIAGTLNGQKTAKPGERKPCGTATRRRPAAK